MNRLDFRDWIKGQSDVVMTKQLKESLDIISDFVTNVMSYTDAENEKRLKGFGLILYGNCGSGKTFTARKVCEYMSKFGRMIRFIPVRESELLRAFEEDGEAKRYRNENILIDDVGIRNKRGSVYTAAHFGREWSMRDFLLDRYEDYKDKKVSTIITTNLEDAKVFGEAVNDRVQEMFKGYSVEFSGPSMR